MANTKLINTLFGSVLLTTSTLSMAAANLTPADKLKRIDLTQIEQLAENGDQQALYQLALMFEYGEHFKADQKKAAALHLQAAKQGHVGAQYSLGVMYLEGKGLAQDNIKAWAWLALAADNGYENVELMRDALTLKMSQVDQREASSAFTTLKNTLPQPYPGSWMMVAAVGK